ncbi:MAG: RNA polymerase factor sigma-54 [Oscillospiraceae bacterium]|nr:RNA polymerase factor sigma-54 [Oscillospiraceae bacterium]
MEQNLNITQKQTLQINARLQQQLRLLHMALPEVCEAVESALNSNPILERGDDSVSASEDFSAVSYNALADSGRARHEQSDDGNQERNTFASQESFYVRRRNDCVSTDWNPIENQAAHESLAEYLSFQLIDYPLDKKQAAICDYLIQSLDARGWFAEDMGDAAKHLGISEFECTQMLYVIQSLDPPGIGARNLEECLILQLASSDNFNPYTIKIVKSCLSLLADNDIAAIARALNISRETAAEYCSAIRSLTPVPSRGYYTGSPECYIVPDAKVTAERGGFKICMNDSLIPPLTMNDGYVKMASNSDDRELTAYLQKNLTDARALVADIENRQKTLFRLIECIVSLQPRFFRDGKTLRPMTMSEIADTLGFNVSTISRAVHDKYIVCAAGTVSLKSLFSSGYTGGESGKADGALSSVVIKRRLVDIVSKESPDAPLSDSALQDIFAREGVTLSRRTIAKYRDELGIASSLKRKNKFSK